MAERERIPSKANHQREMPQRTKDSVVTKAQVAKAQSKGPFNEQDELHLAISRVKCLEGLLQEEQECIMTLWCELLD